MIFQGNNIKNHELFVTNTFLTNDIFNRVIKASLVNNMCDVLAKDKLTTRIRYCTTPFEKIIND